jgi:hypothetical protein
MSAVAVIVSLLQGNAALLAVVAKANIMGGILPTGTTLPAIAVAEVVLTERAHIEAHAVATTVTARVQVTIVANSYPAQKQILTLARKACNYKRGAIAGVSVSSVMRISNGPDFNDPDAGYFQQSVDFAVTYDEVN